MKSFDWEKHAGTLKSYGWLYDFIWDNYTSEQLRHDVTSGRKAFLCAKTVSTALDRRFSNEIYEECTATQLATKSPSERSPWTTAAEMRINVTIAKTLKQIYKSHHALFDMHPKKKIMNLVAVSTPQSWHEEKIDFTGHKTLEDFFRKECKGREILYANSYGNSVEPYFSEENCWRIYKQWKPAVDKFTRPGVLYIEGREHQGDAWVTVNWFAHKCVRALCRKRKTELMKAPWKRLSKTAVREK